MTARAGFALEIDVDPKDVAALDDVELRLQNVNRYLREAKKLGQTDVYKSLRTQQRQLKDEARELNKKLRDQKKDLSDLVDDFRIGGIRIGAFRQGVSNTQKSLGVLTKATYAQLKAGRLLKLLFISSGVGALVVALGSLVAWLTQTQKGIDLVNKAMSIFQAGVGVVVETFTKLFQEGPKALLGIGKRMKEATVTAAGLADETVRQREELRALEVETERVRTREKELSKIAEDTSKSYAERAKAASEAINIEQQLQDKRLAFANRQLEAIKKEVELKGSLALAEDLDLIADKEKEIADIKEESVERITTLNSKLNVSNQGLAKVTSETEKVVSGSLDSLNKKLQELNSQLEGQNLQGNDLRDKIREIIALETELEKIKDQMFAIREEAIRGATPGTFGQLGESDSLQIGASFNFDEENRKDHDDALLEAGRQQTEKLIELEQKRLEAVKEAREKEKEIIEETYGALGEITGQYIGGELKSFQDYANKAAGIFIGLASKQVESLLAPILARLTANLGVPAGPIASAVITGIIRGLLNSSKSKIQQLEEGGQLNPGFLAKGPRHAHGGIPISNGQEIEGGEPVLTRRSAMLFPDAINAINMASGGRKILSDGGILGPLANLAGPVLPSSSFNQGSQIDSKELAASIGSAVYRAAANGFAEAYRRNERENEFINRNQA